MSKVVAKLFMNGRSQAVRLPKEFRFEGDEVFIWKKGDQVILAPKPKSWREFFENVPLPSEDFMQNREDLPPQERGELF
jgi:antitoxin VapB